LKVADFGMLGNVFHEERFSIPPDLFDFGALSKVAKPGLTDWIDEIQSTQAWKSANCPKQRSTLRYVLIR
jgi:hypothetical protein